jgi:hypothetical protein
MNERGQAPRGSPEFDDEGLRDLRDRLDALQRSVEQLGIEQVPDRGEGPDPAPAQAPPAGRAAPRTYAQAPAANGRRPGTTPTPSAPTRTSQLDVGPFAGLIELRRFEEAVAALPAIRDARVRRFGHSRAQIEVVVEGSQSVGRELIRLGKPMRFEAGGADELIVHLPDPEAETEASGAERLNEPEPAGERGRARGR